MIGQSQVTDPLMTALRTDRVNHAYLFSGPRGCGKTTSARILARCLNCAEGPTDSPCGVCPSCVELARDGSGSLDVVEIDAASHNGVDDARDLRERAVFAPARDRFKIFILDEAHMVTPQGFNALLKIVEEPPEHIKFIFATTEPDKVIGTIRSRTHHYPFRLVPPVPMLEYVQRLCDSENVQVEAGVLPLVVRAGGGSVRDTLSLLDQLIAGSETATVSYERAVALLGYTHGALLSEVVDALAAREGASAFEAVDRVIQTGQDPRRFVEDLLERLRDLIVVSATAQGAAAVLRGVQQEELDRMAAQASRFGPADLSRTADIVNAALTSMTGATSPRLHLELMVARILVPAADDSERGSLARVERLERRVGVGGGDSAASPAAPLAQATAHAAPAASSAPAHQPAASSAPGHQPPAPAPPAHPPAATPAHSAPPVVPAPEAPRPVRVGPVTLHQVRDAWPEVLDHVQQAKRTAWMVLVTATAKELREDDVLVLSFPSQNDVNGLKQQSSPGQGVGDYLKRAIDAVLGFTPKLVAVVESAAGTSGIPPAPPADRPSAPPSGPSSEPEVVPGAIPHGVPAGSAARSSPPPPSAPRRATAASPSAVPAASGWETVAIPNDDDAPPPDMGPGEPNYDNEPAATPDAPPADVVPAASAARVAPTVPTQPVEQQPQGGASNSPRSMAAFDGDNTRYGEAVIREVLDAKFVEEVPHSPRSTPGMS